MNQLTTAEKQSHDEKMIAFVERINRCVMPSNLLHKVKLKNVAYGVKVDDAYFYFDFPYDINADALNDALKKNPLIRGIDVRIHEAFFDYQKYDNSGYLAYEYKFDELQQTFLLQAQITNLTVREDDLLTYLPIIHSALHLDTNFLKPVILTTDSVGMSRVLVLCRWPYKSDNRNVENEKPPYQPDKDNILVTTFEITSDEVPIDQLLADQLHCDVLFFADSYFTSPVLEKVFAERRKSEALAYHHSIDNLELDSGINMIEDLITGKEVLNQQNLREFITSLRVVRLMHYLLFQVEYLKANEVGINSGQSIFPLAEKKISAILDQLINYYNIYDIKYELNIQDDISFVDRIPLVGNPENRNPEFYDIVLILWNLLQNAAIVSIGQGLPTVSIDLARYDDMLKVSFTNQGAILNEFFNFINEEGAGYPVRNDKPNKKYRGLEIIKDKCRSHNRNWILKAEISKSSDHLDYTTISVTL